MTTKSYSHSIGTLKIITHISPQCKVQVLPCENCFGLVRMVKCNERRDSTYMRGVKCKKCGWLTVTQLALRRKLGIGGYLPIGKQTIVC